jgi:putative ABC transport system permease protein
MLNDFRLGARIFRRHASLASAAVLSLALGIGANTAIFSVLHTVVLNALPYEDPERLMMVWETSTDNAERWVAPANFVDWRRETRSFASLAAFDEFAPTLVGYGEAERLRALGASGNFFTTLGVTAQIGRTLLPADDEPGAAGVAVLSDGLWLRTFGGSRDVLGRSIVLDGRSYTIAGVMPPHFESPLQSAGIDIWLNGDRGVPRTFPFGGDVTAVRDSHIIYVLGRLHPDASRQSAQQELSAMMVQLAHEYPDTNAGLGVNVVPLHEAVVGNVRPTLVLLQLAVGMMLLIACANVAHLLLGQAAKRQGEIAMRVALGAGRGRLMRQMMAETLVIAVPGGVLGLVLARWGLDALVVLAPDTEPRAQAITIDPTVLVFTVGVTLATAILFGLGPAFQTSRGATAAQANLRVAGDRAVKRWHRAIVVTELALTHVLLVGAGLLLASFAASQRVDLGFQLDGRVAADLSLAPDRYLTPTKPGGFQIDTSSKIQFVERVLDHVRATPGMRAAAAAFTSPLTGAPNRGISIPGRPEKGPGREDASDFQVITPDFFRAVGATLIRGRALTAVDQANTPPVAVINQAFADRYFPGEDPIGQRLQFGGTERPEIVGIVGNMRYRYLETPADPTFYIPMTQNTERWPFMSFTVWADANAASAVSILRDAIRRADPSQAITRVRTYEDILASALAPRRFNTTLVAIFAAAALLLAGIGTYGVMAYAVSTRTRELGVRSALGASPADLMRLVLRQGALLTVAAVSIGAAASFFATRMMTSMLYQVAPRDPWTFVAVAAVLVLVALTATWVPARNAVRVSPTSALREG